MSSGLISAVLVMPQPEALLVQPSKAEAIGLVFQDPGFNYQQSYSTGARSEERLGFIFGHHDFRMQNRVTVTLVELPVDDASPPNHKINGR
jgi:hypothetical protein